ncbi:MAG TPA: VWA domain-containing protein [Vicinamibacteria bacterium]
MKPGALGTALGLALAATSPGRAQAPPVFRAAVEEVYVDVFVTRSGQPVPGLRAANFELRDNRVAQKLELLAAESHPILAILVFDISSSMDGERLAALRAAGEAFLGGLRPADQAALVAFSEQITLLAESTADKPTVRRALASLRALGATSVYDALFAAITLSDQSLRPLVVLFTDGEDNTSWLGEKQIRAMVERSNALVHVVGWRPRPDRQNGRLVPVLSASEPVLREIAEASGGRFWGADSPERLRQAFTAVADAMRHRYVLRYEAQGVKREGWHRIEVRLKGAKGDPQTRRGYWVGR